MGKERWWGMFEYSPMGPVTAIAWRGQLGQGDGRVDVGYAGEQGQKLGECERGLLRREFLRNGVQVGRRRECLVDEAGVVGLDCGCPEALADGSVDVGCGGVAG